MASVWEGLWNAVKNPLGEVKLIGKTLIGKESLKDLPGDHQRQMNKVTVPLLGNNKLSKNSDAAAGAVIGGIFAAPLLAGGASAAGGSTAGAAGAAGGTSLGTGASFGSLGSATAGSVGTGTASGFGGVGGMGVTGSTTGFGGVGGMMGTTASSGTLSSGMGGAAGMTSGAGSMGSLSSYFTPSTQFGTEAMSAGKTFTPAETTTDWTRLANSMKNLKSQTDYQNKAPEVQLRSTGGRGMSFDSNRFKNAALEREYQSIYSSPTYKKLV